MIDQRIILKRLFVLLVCASLYILPFIFESRTLLILCTQIFIFAIFAMSYDLLLGYTGIVSFGHAMFFGIGAYTIAIFIGHYGSSLSIFFLSLVVVILLTSLVSIVLSLLTLRLKSHFFAMLTLSVSGLFLVLAEKWRSVTKGNDGFTFLTPELFRDRASLYYVVLTVMLLTLFLLLHFTRSPLGTVIQAIRENERRTYSLGYKVLSYKVIISTISGVLAGISGMFYAMSLRFVNTSVFSIDMTLDALLMTIIGGAGTLIGPIIGAVFIEIARHGLMDLAKVHWIFERWIILFGMLFILAMIFFPKGITGTLIERLSFKRGQP